MVRIAKWITKKTVVNTLLCVLGIGFCGMFFFSSQIDKVGQKMEKVKKFVEKHDISPRGGVKDMMSAAVTAVKYETGSFAPESSISTPIRGNLRVEIIDPNTICVVGDYDAFLRERFLDECGGFMKGIESDTGNVPQWSKSIFYNVLVADIILKYRPAIARAYNDWHHFKISNETQILNGGYWVNPIGQMVVPSLKDGKELHTRNAQVAHFCYLRFIPSLQEGKEYVIENPLGESIKFQYQEEKNISGAIKVNQLGYSTGAGKKYAYMGLWLGTLGPLDMSPFDNKSFHLCKEDTGEIVYRGFFTKRMAEQYYKGGAPFTGENVYEMDFSEFNEPGRYYIHVPNLGRSYSFVIGEDAIGEAFYIHAKGLYHKRCGIAKESPYTEWHSGECHTKTYRSNFPPNDRHYDASKEPRDYGFFDEQGNSVAVKHFTLIEANHVDEVVEGVAGGWHDAADYDRRPYHYDVVNDLLSVYLMRPENFPDGQLNIHESGNGISDLLDEAIWGMEVWRKAQLESGAVGGWIEANSHPSDWNPATDAQHYYLSAATMESSMQYAAHASLLALALKKANQDSLSEKYLQSAIAAYNFGSNTNNRFTATYQYPINEKIDGKTKKRNVTYTYKEESKVPIALTFKTVLNLILLTGNEEYVSSIKDYEKDLKREIVAISWKYNPLFFQTLLKFEKTKDPVLQSLYKAYRNRIIDCANERIKWLEENYPYRIPWYPVDHAYVTYMSWGHYHPFRNAYFFILAYEATKNQIYRDAVYLCNDWHCGANPSGQTMTSGLGQDYPVKFLDLPSYTDEIDEYVLGITPYRNTFGIARDDVKLAHALFYDARADRKFYPKPAMLFSASFLGKTNMTVDEFSAKLGSTWPIWRRFANVESYSVAASEYTVSETIAPSVMATGWLLNEPWMPSEKIKTRKPVNDIRVLKGYATLP